MSNPSTPPVGGERSHDPLAELLAAARSPHDRAAERNTWLAERYDEAGAVRAALYSAGRWYPEPGEPHAPAGWAAALAGAAPLIGRHDLAGVYDDAAGDDPPTRLAKAVVRAARASGAGAVATTLANVTGILEADVRERLAVLAGAAGELLAGRIAAEDRERWPDLAEPDLEPSPAPVAEEPEGKGETEPVDAGEPMPADRAKGGAYAPGCFRLPDGKPVHGIPGKQWGLLAALMSPGTAAPTEPRPVLDVWRAVYGREAYDRGRLKSMKTALNETLNRLGVPIIVAFTANGSDLLHAKMLTPPAAKS